MTNSTDHSSPHRDTPTVVIARSPLPGKEREFERWLRRLARAAGDAPGFVASDVQPPADSHPGEWVIVYQFADSAALERWLTSDVRREIIDDGGGLSTGDAREQILALAPQRESVTAVASFTVKAGFERRYDEAHHRLVGRLETFPGFLSCELFPPVPGVQDETVVLFSFDSRQHLDAWLGSQERAEVLTEVEPYLDSARTVNVIGGFGGWFGRPGMAAVKRWKQASVVLLALFPTSLTLTVLRQWLLPDIGLVPSVAIANTLGVIILSWGLMPVLTRVLDGWLRR